MFLEVHNISKSYSNIPAIQDISFQLDKGKLLCLLGPSGCGKSTILNALGGFISLDSGKIVLDGQDITQMPPEDRQVATVFQSYGLFPHMSVIENIQYGLKFQKIPRNQRRSLAMDMIEKINLIGSEHKKVAQLSGGQQQRVALGRSLIIKPKLLLLDEPLSNLDAKLRISLREEIRHIQKSFDVTMIFVTHDQMEAFEIADEIILMKEGHIVQTGTGPDLYHHPADAFVLSFIGNNNQEQDHYVRPEDVHISRQGPGRKAWVRSIIFQGSTSRITLELENQHVIDTLVLSNQADYKINDLVYVNYQLQSLS